MNDVVEQEISSVCNPLLQKAQKIEDLATKAQQRAEDAVLGTAEPLWDEAITHAVEVKEAWNLVIETYQKNRNLVSGQIQSKWALKLESVKNAKNEWLAKKLSWETGKAIDIASRVFSIAVKNMNTSEAGQAWKEVSNKIAQVENSWDLVIEAYENSFKLAPNSLKDRWRTNLILVKDEKNQWVDKTLWKEATQASANAIVASQQENWQLAIKMAGIAHKAWYLVIEACQKSCDTVENSLNNWWLKQLDRAKNRQYQCDTWIVEWRAAEAQKKKLEEKRQAAEEIRRKKLEEDAAEARKKHLERESLSASIYPQAYNKAMWDSW